MEKKGRESGRDCLGASAVVFLARQWEPLTQIEMVEMEMAVVDR